MTRSFRLRVSNGVKALYTLIGLIVGLVIGISIRP